MEVGISSRIERRLKKLGLNPRQASLMAGGSPALIRNIQRGLSKSPRSDTMIRLAAVLETTMPWLTQGEGDEEIPEAGAERTIPVWGKAGAGGIVHRFDGETGEIDRIRAPEHSNPNTGAVEIEGDSLGTLFNRWYAVYDDVRDPPTRDLLGELCVVELSDGRVFIKRLAKGRGKRFTLESNYDAPIYDVDVVWAARVKTMVPR